MSSRPRNIVGSCITDELETSNIELDMWQAKKAPNAKVKLDIIRMPLLNWILSGHFTWRLHLVGMRGLKRAVYPLYQLERSNIEHDI